jgi:toxin ParE1/3/4
VLRIVNSSLADADLLEIWLYTAEEWNLSQADKYLDQLANTLKNLVDHPEMGKERDELRKGYRSLLVNHHIVFYRVIDDEIQIMRVLHESVDLASHL